MSDDKAVFTYVGRQAEVTWHGGLCIHVQECARARGELFVGGRDPWCQPDLASTDEIIEVVSRCPTGALSVQRRDGGAPESAPEANVTVVTSNGPLVVRGDLRIDGAPDNAPGLRFRASLCRCGHSKRKPFCDNSHEDANFRDHGAVGETGEPGEAGGPLRIRAAPNGPLLFSGHFTIVSGGARLAWSGNRAALCRCGHSDNKPFCDGTHKQVGFEAE